jgi:hypothetical protein
MVVISHFKLKLFLNATLDNFFSDYLHIINKGPVHLPADSIFLTLSAKYQTVITIRAPLRTLAQMHFTTALNLSESDQSDSDSHLRRKTKQVGSCESQEMLMYGYGECEDGR